MRPHETFTSAQSRCEAHWVFLVNQDVSPPASLQSSAGVRRRFLKGAVGGPVEDGSVGCQHVASWFLGASLRLWLGGSLLRGLLVLVLFRQTGAGRGASLRDQLGSGGRLIAAVMLLERGRDRTGSGKLQTVCARRAKDKVKLFLRCVFYLIDCVAGSSHRNISKY